MRITRLLAYFVLKIPSNKTSKRNDSEPCESAKGKRNGGRVDGKDGKQYKAWARPKS